MSASAESLIVSLQPSEKARGASPLKSFERVFAAKLRAVRAPSSALVFISGANELAGDVATAVARLAPSMRALVIPAKGVLSELAEIEGAAASSALIWSGPKPRVDLGASALEAGDGGGTRLLFPSASITAADLGRIRGSCTIGGTAAGESIFAIEEGRVTSASVAALVVSGQGAPVVEQSSSCKVIASPLMVTKASRRAAGGTLVSEILELDGSPALEMLSKTVGRIGQPGLIVFSLLYPDAPDRHLFRTIKGVDPSKKAILVESDVNTGDNIALASRDATHARADLSEALRRAEQRALGSAPRFALFVSCAARGRSLYREPDVDVKILKKRFPKLPIAGMHAGLQLVPWGADDREVALQQMSGLLGLFRAPS